MRYYVLAPTGERYGPADVPTLNQWVADGRVAPNARLMEELSGSVVAASSVPGLTFASTPIPPPSPTTYAPMSPPMPGAAYQPPTNYPRPGMAYGAGLPADNGSKDLWAAFGMAVGAPLLGFISFYGIFLAIAGVGASWRAYQKGQKLGILALVLNVLAIGGAFFMRVILRHELFRRF